MLWLDWDKPSKNHGREVKRMEQEGLKKLMLDAEKGVLIVNGEELKNVTALTLIFKDGEYGLQITHCDNYSSKTEISKIFLDLLPK